jgi:hypothetical protein
MADTADTADTMANTANILARYRREADATSAEAGGNSAAANRANTATGAAKTGEEVIGAAIGGVAVTGAAADDSSLAADLVIRTTGIGTPIGAGAILTRTAIILIGIILRICTLTTVAPYQDSDSLGPDPSWFPAPASSGNCASGIPTVKSHYGSLKTPACSCVSITLPDSS